MKRELIYEPQLPKGYGNHEGWTAWDGEICIPIPGSENLTAKDFDKAIDCAVAAWGETWSEAIEAPFDGSAMT